MQTAAPTKNELDNLLLPEAKGLIRLLDLLGEAERTGKSGDAKHYEAMILGIIPVDRLYEGYADDVGLKTSVVRLVGIERKGPGANRHTFRATLEVFEDGVAVKTIDLDLVDVLSEVNRERPVGGQQVGRRFWYFE